MRMGISPNDGSSLAGGKGAFNVHTQVADREIQNTDKAIINLIKEHAKLKKKTRNGSITRVSCQFKT